MNGWKVSRQSRTRRLSQQFLASFTRSHVSLILPILLPQYLKFHRRSFKKLMLTVTLIQSNEVVFFNWLFRDFGKKLYFVMK